MWMIYFLHKTYCLLWGRNITHLRTSSVDAWVQRPLVARALPRSMSLWVSNTYKHVAGAQATPVDGETSAILPLIPWSMLAINGSWWHAVVGLSSCVTELNHVHCSVTDEALGLEYGEHHTNDPGIRRTGRSQIWEHIRAISNPADCRPRKLCIVHGQWSRGHVLPSRHAHRNTCLNVNNNYTHSPYHALINWLSHMLSHHGATWYSVLLAQKTLGGPLVPSKPFPWPWPRFRFIN